MITPDALRPYAPGVWDPDADPAELYYLPDDFTQAHDLAADHPEKVAELKELFWAEAEKYKVLPLLATLSAFFGILPPVPDAVPVEYRGDVQNVMSGMIPRIYNHSYAISADLVVPAGGAEGVIVAEADHLGGFSLWVQDGKLTHTYSMMGVFIYRQQADEPLPAGEVTVRMEFAADAPKPATGGEVTLYINDRPVGKGRMDHTVPIRFSAYAGMDIGRDNGGVVDLSYEDKKPFAVHRHRQEGRLRRQAASVGPGRGRAARGRPHGHAAHALSRMRQARSLEEGPMKFDDETTDVLIGGYLSKDAAQDDYEAVLASGGYLHGAVVVSKDLEGNLSVEQTDHMVREGAAGLGAVGFAVGLFAPPLLAATAVGAVIGAGAGKLLHHRTASKLEEQAGATIPVGGAGLIVAYPHSAAAKVEPAVTRAIKKVVGEAEGHHVKALKGAIADAQQKMAESGT